MRVRTRETVIPSGSQVLGLTDYVCLSPWSKSKSLLSGPIKTFAAGGRREKKMIVDENHGVRERYDVGGPLYIASVMSPSQIVAGGTFISGPGLLPHGAATHTGTDGSDWRIRYSGSFQLTPEQWGGWPTEPVWPSTQLHPQLNPDDGSSLGSRGYARLRPKPNKGSAFQALYEAKDIPRTLKKSLEPAAEAYRSIVNSSSLSQFSKREALRAKRMPKNLAQQYLNTVFGWAPLVDDVGKLCELVINFDEHVDRMKRVNGEWQHRRFREQVVEQEEVLSSQTATSNFCTPGMGPGWVVPQSGRLQVVRQTVTQIWYEGSFKQYYPEFDDSLMAGHPAVARVAQAVRSAGLEINPVNVYSVLPWTWLVDWGVNVRDNLQVLTDLATDAVVSRYFYVMRRTIHRFVYRVSWSFVTGGSVSFEALAGHEIKRRVVGLGSFGFSAPPGGLSGKQLGVLAALGIDRAT